MEKRFGQNDPKIADYAEETFNPEDKVLKSIRERSQKANLPPIQVGAMDGLHLEILSRCISAQKAVEIGTLGGYSAVCIARGLKPGGKLYTLEISSKAAEVAKQSVRAAGLEDRVEVILGSALESLKSIEKHGPFDLVFIDADKNNYANYLKWAEKNLRQGGVVLADNTFAWGLIAQENVEDPEDRSAVEGLRKFNREIANNPSFRATILPTGEGLTVGVKI